MRRKCLHKYKSCAKIENNREICEKYATLQRNRIKSLERIGYWGI